MFGETGFDGSIGLEITFTEPASTISTILLGAISTMADAIACALSLDYCGELKLS
ncbi:hypothetical protein MGH68_13685 [Erysipelothrix sp. D19-032]